MDGNEWIIVRKKIILIEDVTRYEISAISPVVCKAELGLLLPEIMAEISYRPTYIN